MIIRTATENDLDTILALGEQFGHRMLYIKDPELMKRYLNRIIVAEETSALHKDYHEVVGFYHYIVSGDPGFIEMLTCYRQFEDGMISEALDYEVGDLCVAMQGACHRDAFQELIGYLQSKYSVMWCYNSITDQSKPSSKISGYQELGFTYDSTDKFKFFNVHKGDYSTYQLGRWTK